MELLLQKKRFVGRTAAKSLSSAYVFSECTYRVFKCVTMDFMISLVGTMYAAIIAEGVPRVQVQ
jgi:hypothetical protein